MVTFSRARHGAVDEASHRVVADARRLDTHTALVAGSGALLPVLVIVGLPQPVQALLAVALLGLVPGYAITRLMPLGDALIIALVSVAMSLALATAVSTALLYLSAWSWEACAIALGVVTLGASAARLRTEPPC